MREQGRARSGAHPRRSPLVVAVERRAATLLRYANRREKGKSTNAESGVSRQLSPFEPGNLAANTRRSAWEEDFLPDLAPQAGATEWRRLSCTNSHSVLPLPLEHDTAEFFQS